MQYYKPEWGVIMGESAWNRDRRKKFEEAQARAARMKNPAIPGLRVRHDGWTEERTRRFLDVLAHTACVRDACRVAGVSNTSAYRHRRHSPDFASAWDDVLARAGQGLVAIAYKHAVEGKETVIIRNGEEVERRIAPSDALLSLLIKRSDKAGGEGAFAHKDLADIPREEILTLAKWQQHIRFSPYNGSKILEQDPVVALREHREKIAQLRAGLRGMAGRGDCPCCQQRLPDPWPKVSLMALDTLGIVELGKLRLADEAVKMVKKEQSEQA